MKKSNFKILLLLSTIISLCQTPQWEWVFGEGAINYDRAYGIAVDSNNNIFVSGHFNGTLITPFDTLNSQNEDIFVARLDSLGNLIWIKQYGGSGDDRGYQIDTDPWGNICITGFFNGTCTFDSFSVSSFGNDDIFISKLDSNGNTLWLKSGGGNNSEVGYGLSIDYLGNVFVSGHIRSQSYFDSFFVPFNGDYDIVVLKYNSTGSVIWAQSFGSYGDDRSVSNNVDDYGNCYVVGNRSGSFYIGDINSTGYGNKDITVIKLSTIGNVIWSKTFGGIGFDLAQGVDIDKQGNCYVSGFFSDTGYFDNITLNSFGGSDVSIIKIDTIGNVLWAKQYGGNLDDRGHGIKTLNNKIILVSHIKSNDSIGNLSISSIGDFDIAVTQLDDYGNIEWELRAGSTLEDKCFDIESYNKNLIISGDFSSISDFGNHHLTTQGNKDFFIAKINSCIALTSSLIEDTVFCEGQTINLGFWDTNYSYYWNTSQTTPSILVSQNGNYVVTVSNSCGSYIDSCLVNSKNTPSISLLQDTIICNGLSIQIGSSDTNYLYNWNTNQTTSSIEVSQSGNYSVTVSNVCGTDIDSVNIIQSGKYHIGFNNVCADPINQTSGSIDLVISGGTQPYSFSWSNGETTEDISNAEYGKYQLTVSDAYSCDTSISTFVDFNILPDWEFNHPGLSHNIIIPQDANIQFNGTSLNQNDFIGVFYDSLGSLACGGYTIWKNNTCTIKAYGQNFTSINPDGFRNSENFTWIIWDLSDSTEYKAIASYSKSFPDQALWNENGRSLIDSLQSICISGTVTLNAKSLLPNGIAILYSIKNFRYYPVEKTLINDGNFLFNGGLLPGKYLLHAIPVPNQNYGLPGYYVNEINWEQANSIYANGFTQGVDISIDPATTMNGIASISGQVLIKYDPNYNPDIFNSNWFSNSKKSNNNQAQNISIILYNSDISPIEFQLSNNEGKFKFTNLLLGTYYISIEKPGIYCNKKKIILSEDELHFSGLNITIDSNQVTTTICESEFLNYKILPNPATDYFYIQHPQLYKTNKIQILDISGHLVFSNKLDFRNYNESIKINTSKLISGIYFIKLNQENKQILLKFIICKN